MDVPESLKHRIALFQKNAHAFQAPNELFRVDSWTQVMLGQGLMPESYHHIVKTMSDKELNQFLPNMREGMQRAVDQLPTHQEFVDSYCKAQG